MKLILILIAGYLIGSIPFALVVGKLFYHTDVRKYGSGNLGGGNTGRVLGKKAGTAVAALDLLKVTLIVFLAKCLFQGDAPAGARALAGVDAAMALGALAAGIGHCFPVFAGFHGGKAVAAMYGYLFGLFAVGGRSPLYFFLPLIVFTVVLYLTKIISLSSMVSASAITAYAWIRPEAMAHRLVLLAFTVIIIVRHRANIARMMRHEENKISWM